MEKGLNFLGKVLTDPDRPFVAIIGGSKISGKIDVIDNLLDKADTLLIGGGMAYTFLNALGQSTGKSLIEADKIDVAKAALEKAKAKGVKLLLPSTTCWPTSSQPTPRRKSSAARENLPPNWMALDIGPARSIYLPRRLPTRARFCGTAQWGSSSLLRLRMGRMQLRSW